MNREHPWTRHFAWLPVRIQNWTDDGGSIGKLIWLRHYECRYWASAWFDDYFDIRLPQPLSQDTPNG